MGPFAHPVATAMRRKRLLVVLGAIAIALFAGATCVKAMLNSLPKVADFSPCRSAEEARRRGTWVRDVAVTPAELRWRGHDIAFLEAWEEAAATPDHFLVWFPYYRRSGRNYLCFRLAKGQELFPASGGRPFPCFLLEGERYGFGIDFTHKEPGTFYHWSDGTCPLPLEMGISPAPREPADAYDITLAAQSPR